MGMYTKFEIDVVLKRTTPSYVLDALKYLETKEWWAKAGGISAAPGVTINEQVDDVPEIDHPFWKEPRMCQFKVRLDGLELHVDANIKNYNGEIESFLAFLSEHVDTQVGEGSYRYEEDPEPSKISYNKETGDFDIESVPNI